MKTLSIDLGGSRAKLAVVRDGEYQDLRVVAVDAANSMRETLSLLGKEGQALLRGESVEGIGFSFPGIVRDGKIVESNGKYCDAQHIDMEAWAQETFGCGIAVMNDAAAALLGELTFGVGKGSDAAVMMIIGTGIGTAAATGGQVLKGRHGTMGILGGHITVEAREKRRCTCGNLGCLEAWAGSWALPGLAAEQDGFAQSMLARVPLVDYRTMYEGVRQGDEVACRLFAQTVDMLGAGAVNLVHAYDPDILILSGGAAHIPELVKGIEETVHNRAWTPWGKVEVRVAENPEASVVLGLHALWQTQEKKE